MTQTHLGGDSSGPAASGVQSPGRASIAARTLRTDRWWVEPAVTFTLLVGVAALRAGPHGVAALLLRRGVPLPHAVLLALRLGVLRPRRSRLRHAGSASSRRSSRSALLILPFLLGFRLTCYYYRKAYYRSFWLSPPACAVAEPHAKYTGETRFPLILQNVAPVLLLRGVVVSLINTYDAIRRLPRQGRRLRHRARHRHHAGQRRPALGLHAVLPLLPAHHRRPAQALLQAPGPLPAVDARSRSSTPGTWSWPGSTLGDARGHRRLHHALVVGGRS